METRPGGPLPCAPKRAGNYFEAPGAVGCREMGRFDHAKGKHFLLPTPLLDARLLACELISGGPEYFSRSHGSSRVKSLAAQPENVFGHFLPGLTLRHVVAGPGPSFIRRMEMDSHHFTQL
ncbi:UNVERIFIED_CONTAM: hypothetical protein K2H54_002835 [Gekko kuhli]